MIKIIKSSPSPNDAKLELMKREWSSNVVVSMLKKDDPKQYQPEGLLSIYGLKEKGYKLSDTQAQEILQMRLQRLTGLEQDKLLQNIKRLWMLYRI